MLSVIIVTWNSEERIIPCLSSLSTACATLDHEIIVVDNNSQDNTVSLIQQHFSHVIIWQEPNNWGYGKGNNLGVRHSKGSFILILNPDTEVPSETLNVLLDTIQENPSIGFIGPKILNSDGSFQAACRRSIPTPQSALFKISGLSKLFPKHPTIAQYNLGHLDPDQPSEVEAISGSCMLFRREAYGQGFDLRYFMYAEDLDICLTIRQKGLRGFYQPQAVITHHHRGSSSKRWVKSTFHFYYSAYLFFQKHYANKMNLLTKTMIVAGLILATSAALIKKWLQTLVSRNANL